MFLDLQIGDKIIYTREAREDSDLASIFTIDNAYEIVEKENDLIVIVTDTDCFCEINEQIFNAFFKELQVTIKVFNEMFTTESKEGTLYWDYGALDTLDSVCCLLDTLDIRYEILEGMENEECYE